MEVKKVIAVAIVSVTVGAVAFGIAVLREFFQWMDDVYWQNPDAKGNAAKDHGVGGDGE